MESVPDPLGPSFTAEHPRYQASRVSTVPSEDDTSWAPYIQERQQIVLRCTDEEAAFGVNCFPPLQSRSTIEAHVVRVLVYMCGIKVVHVRRGRPFPGAGSALRQITRSQIPTDESSNAVVVFQGSVVSVSRHLTPVRQIISSARKADLALGLFMRTTKASSPLAWSIEYEAYHWNIYAGR